MGYKAVGTAWGFKVQSGFGSAGAVDKWIPFITESVSPSKEALEVVDSQSRNKRDNDPLGRVSVGGDINTHIEPVNVGYPFYFLMGSASVTTNSPVTGAHTHTFSQADTIPYFTSELKWGTIGSKGKKIYDCKMASATFDFAEDVLSATWNIAGADYSGNVTVSGISAYPNKRRFTYKDASLKITPKDGAAVTVKLKSGTLTVDNGLITDDASQGKTTVDSLEAGAFSCNGSFDYALVTGTDLDDWLNGTKKATVEFIYAGDTITGSTAYKLTFKVPNARVLSENTNMNQNELITRHVEFESFWDAEASAGDDKFNITLINNQSGAYNA